MFNPNGSKSGQGAGPSRVDEPEALDFWVDTETVTVVLVPPRPGLPRGVWVKIKRQLSWGEDSMLDTAIIRGFSRQQLVDSVGKDDPGALTTLVDLRKQRLLKAALFIDSWNVPSPNGQLKTWPPTIEERMRVLSELSPKWGKRIDEEIERLRAEDAELATAQGIESIESGGGQSGAESGRQDGQVIDVSPLVASPVEST